MDSAPFQRLSLKIDIKLFYSFWGVNSVQETFKSHENVSMIGRENWGVKKTGSTHFLNFCTFMKHAPINYSKKQTVICADCALCPGTASLLSSCTE